MTRNTRVAFAAAMAFTLSTPAMAQMEPTTSPVASATKGSDLVVFDREFVLVEPANLGVPKSRTVIVAGTGKDRYHLTTGYDQAAVRTRWISGAGSRNFLVERTEFERMQRVAHNSELAFLGMSAVDAVQTIVAVSNGKAIELNPLLGRKPSAQKIIAFKTLTSGLHYALFRYANARNPNTARKGAIGSFVVQSGYVGFSLALGH